MYTLKYAKTEGYPMFAVTVLFRVSPEDADAFGALVRENARASLRTEAGCVQFDVCTDPATPGDVFLYELYDDAAAFDAHLASDHFKAFDEAVKGMVQVKTVRTYTEVHQ